MIPHDLATERAVLGAVMYGSARMVDVSPLVAVGDFYDPTHGAIWLTLETLHSAGEKVTDAVLVHSELEKAGERHSGLIPGILAEAPASWKRHVASLVRLSVSRRVQYAATELALLAEEAKLDPADLLAEAAGAFTSFGSTEPGDSGLSTFDDFLSSSASAPAPWVVPGLLRRGWRALIVAPEGVGKSVCARQIAIAAAQGLEPFTGRRASCAARTLLIDLENPDDAIAETARPISDHAAKITGYDTGDLAWIWRRPAGINLRERRDSAALAGVIERTKPDLVVLGPLYKAYRSTARESDELAAGEVQAVLDDLRTRHDFALLMEHHAPKGGGLGARDLVPYGSSLWLRWPELGLKLIPCNDDEGPPGSLRVGKWRMDRMKHGWPDRLDRGGLGAFPWVGYWRNGLDQLATA